VTTLYNFTGGGDGDDPQAILIQASDGNFYGTAAYGALGTCFGYGCGTVFQMTPSGVLTTIYQFTGESDGGSPSANLIEGSDGNLYGVTSYGGANLQGTLFRITLDGKYTFTTLYSFPDGGQSLDALVQGADGSLYGDTQYGGESNCGYVYSIGLDGGGFNQLYAFGDDGCHPFGNMVQAADGNFYGTTSGTTGGSGNPGGNVFKITPGGDYKNLLSFPDNQSDGSNPQAGLWQATDGFLYGTTYSGGPDGDICGTLFKISTSGTISTLQPFSQQTNGCEPQSTPFQATDGNVYATTSLSGNGNTGFGTIFNVTTGGAFKTLFYFDEKDGSLSYSGFMQGSDGALYAATEGGGKYGVGTIYKLTSSPALAAPVTLTPSSTSIALGGSVKLSWKELEAASTTMQQCYAHVDNAAQNSGAGDWSGKQTGSLSGGVFSGSKSVMPSCGGTFTYALTCGGIESGLATVTVAGTEKSKTTTALAAAPTSVYTGQNVVLTATLTQSDGCSVPTGKVQFLYGTEAIATASLDKYGVARYTASTSGLPDGKYSITAKYLGDGNNDTSTSPAVAVTLKTKTQTATTLTASPNPAYSNQTLVLTAQVKPKTGSAIPTGSVNILYDGGAIFNQALDSHGTATLSFSVSGLLSLVPPGDYILKAQYPGDANNAGSTSSPVTVVLKSGTSGSISARRPSAREFAAALAQAAHQPAHK
jgi:uncharacterized repeat protein (TIGR03803 family)